MPTTRTLRWRPKGLASVSPAGRIPALRHGSVELYESLVMAEYLAEVHGWADAWPSDAGLRARHRLACPVFELTGGQDVRC